MKKLLLLLLAILLITACKKSGTNPPNPPNPVIATITTTAASAITSTTATSGGNITSDGGATITERGICFNTSTNPTTSNNKVASGSGTGSFTANMTGLTAGTTYYVKSYAINSAGTAYSSEVSFTTSATLATITTTAASAITSTTATSGGNVTSDGGATITERGICFNTSANPTTSNNKVVSGSGTGSFTANMTGLTAGTTYYVKSYAINSAGTVYGNEVSFTTSATLATITTTTASSIISTTATTGGNITNDGGATITERGICFNTSANPTTSNNKVVSGSGTGSFTSNMTGLTPGTIYYARAYAINSAGTAYGNQVSFTTIATEVTICSQVWMVKNLDVSNYRNGDPIPQVTDPTQWVNLTTGAWCYYNNDPANGAVYSKLYNWYAVIDPRGLAPLGWHIPTKAEWTTLSTCLGGPTPAGGQMKTTGTIEAGTGLWYAPNTGATNSSGFTGLPGGLRFTTGDSRDLGTSGFWWTITEYDINNGEAISLYTAAGTLFGPYWNKYLGFSVRCVKD